MYMASYSVCWVLICQILVISETSPGQSLSNKRSVSRFSSLTPGWNKRMSASNSPEIFISTGGLCVKDSKLFINSSRYRYSQAPILFLQAVFQFPFRQIYSLETCSKEKNDSICRQSNFEHLQALPSIMAHTCGEYYREDSRLTSLNFRAKSEIFLAMKREHFVQKQVSAAVGACRRWSKHFWSWSGLPDHRHYLHQRHIPPTLHSAFQYS